MKDCYCKNCGMEYAWVNDKDSGDCWSCKKPLVATKRRPTKRASDAPKACAKIKHQKDKIVKGRARR